MMASRGPASLADNAARGSLITLVAQGLRIVTQFASIVILARLLSPTDYGYLAMVLAIVGVAELLRDFGLSAAAVQSRELSHAQQSNLFWLNALIGLTASIVVAALSPLIAGVYGVAALQSITLMIAPVFLLNGLTTQFKAHINRDMRFLTLSVTEVLPQIVAFGVAIVIALLSGSYLALVAQQLTVAAIGLATTVGLARWWPGFPNRRGRVGGLVRFGGNLFGTNLLTYATNNSQIVMLGAAWGPVVVGYFSRAYQLMALPLTQLVAPLTKVALPILSKVQDDPVRYRDIVGRAQLLGLYLTAPLFMACFGLAQPLIAVALGPQWSASAPIFAVLSLGGAFRAMSQLAYWMFLSSGSTNRQLRFNAVALPALIVVMAAGLPWGGLGVAVGHTVGYAIYWPLSMWFAARAAGVPIGPLALSATRVFGLVGLGVAALSFGATLIPMLPILQILVGVLGAVVWTAAISLSTRSGRRDLRVLRDFISRAR